MNNAKGSSQIKRELEVTFLNKTLLSWSMHARDAEISSAYVRNTEEVKFLRI